MRYRHILLIDDDQEDHEIFKTALSVVSEQVQCTALTNGIDALDKLTGGKLNPDLIFLDLNMPLMSGQEFLLEIKRREEVKEIPVIIYSTSSNQNTITLMKELGAVNFITKPSRFDTLIEVLKPIIN